MMQVQFIFDVDGVVLDFESSYMRVLSELFQLPLPKDYRPEKWNFSDVLNKEQMIKGWEYFIQSHHFEELAPLVDPARFNQTFEAYPVHFVTNIPPQYIPKRETNLGNLGFQYKSLNCGGFLSFDDYTSKTKAEVIQTLVGKEDLIFFLDDHPDNCLNVLEQYPDGHIWLMSRSFNEGFSHPSIHRTHQWKEILHHCETLQRQNSE